MRQSSAEIIPFPAPVPPVTPTVEPAERLRLALASLDAALKEQGAAVAQWRQSLASLRHGVAGMAGSAQRLQGQLADLQHQVQATNEVARQVAD